MDFGSQWVPKGSQKSPNQGKALGPTHLGALQNSISSDFGRQDASDWEKGTHQSSKNRPWTCQERQKPAHQ